MLSCLFAGIDLGRLNCGKCSLSLLPLLVHSARTNQLLHPLARTLDSFGLNWISAQPSSASIAMLSKLGWKHGIEAVLTSSKVHFLRPSFLALSCKAKRCFIVETSFLFTFASDASWLLFLAMRYRPSLPFTVYKYQLQFCSLRFVKRPLFAIIIINITF